MGQDYDLLLKNGYVHSINDVVDIGVKDGTITTIASTVTDDAATTIDAEGNVVTPAFVDPHLRLDRILTAEGDSLPNGNEGNNTLSQNTLSHTANLLEEYYANHSFDEIVQNAVDATQLAIINGTTHIRAHVAVDYDWGPKLFEACEAAAERTSEICDIELVPASGLNVLSAKSEAGIREVCGNDSYDNVDVVGGSIRLSRLLDYGAEKVDINAQIDQFFEFATDYDADLEMHASLRDAAGYYAYKKIFEKIREHDYQGRTTTIHNRALAHLPDWWTDDLMPEFQELDHKMMIRPPSMDPSMPIETIMDHGITFASCTDNARDLATIHGNADQLEAAQTLAHKLQGHHHDHPQRTYYGSNPMLDRYRRMITEEAAKIVGHPNYGIEEGGQGDLVVFDETSMHWAIAKHSDCQYVIKEGNIVVENAEPTPEFEMSDYS
jgi:cytosine deaminase